MAETETTGSKIRWIEALRALLALARHNDDTTKVFRIVEALRGSSDHRRAALMRRDPVGRAILREGRSLIDVLNDRDRLRALPEGSLGRVYLAFMEREGLSADGLAGASDAGYATRSDDPELETYRNWARDSHDLLHVVTGYGRDPLGELSLLGVTYMQTRNPGTAFIALLGLLQVPYEYPGGPSVRAVLQGFWNGWRARWLLPQDWERLLEKPIDAVRAELGLAAPHFYQRAVACHDPSRSWSRPMPEAS